MNKFSTKPTRAVLDRLGSPDGNLKIIHIAGTNGKGSTAEFFTNVLLSAGKKTGTFTSPQIYCYNDQFRIDGKPVPEDKLNSYFAAAGEQGISASDFETETAGILYAFAQEGCEYAVIECGMGGLNDATNAIRKKELAVITSVSLEHTEYLGDTIGKICVQKAGIIKDCPAVVNAYQSAEAISYFKSLGAVIADKSLSDNFEINAQGSLQPYNAATAIAGSRLLGIDEEAIYEGIKNTKPRGRLEIFNANGTRYILDGAHNPAAFKPLHDLLEKTVGSKAIIFGCLSDKDIDGNLKAIQNSADEVIAVKCPGHRARDLEQTAQFCRKYFKTVRTASSVEDALSVARAETLAVCGSFTLLGDAKKWIEKRQ